MNRKIMVIDGNSLLHRAFYAIPVLTNKRGVFTNAVYGFTNMLLKLIDDYNPDWIGVAFDRKAPTFRHKVYGDYKAGRQKMPEELSPQFELLKGLLELLDINIYELDGYEADDILGTIAKTASEQGRETLVVTGDKDALQLISDSTKVVITKKGISEVRLFDISELEEEYGLTPAQFIDMKGLMGDSSDNIPGVPGVGQKTALKLLEQFKTLESVLEHIDDVKGNKLKENLRLYKEQAVMSKELATIELDVPIDLLICDDTPYKVPVSPALKSYLQDLGFGSVIKKLRLTEVEATKIEPTEIETSVIQDTAKRAIEKNYIELFSIEELIQLVERCKNESELTFLLGEDLSIWYKDNTIYRISFKEDLLSHGVDYIQALEVLKGLFENEKIRKITHDAKRVMLELYKYDIKLKGLYFDTYIAAYLLDPTQSKYELEQLLYEYIKIDTMAADGLDLHMLYLELYDSLKNSGMLRLYETIEQPLIEVLAGMEISGFRVDKNILDELDIAISKEVGRLTQLIYELTGGVFNINSPKQLGEVLFEKLGLPVSKKTKTGYSTDIEVLEQLKDKHPSVGSIIEYRQVMKLKSTYIDGLLQVINARDGRIHSSFNQAVTATGRISSTEPNLQNIPIRLEMGRNIRKVFVSSGSDYVLVDADYSQIELRVLAHISKDPTFIEAFVENQDIHRRTASEIFSISMDEVTTEQRNSAKAVNFGIVYGISDFGLSRNLGISRAKAKEYIELYLNRYPGVKTYMEGIIEEGKDKGFVTTLLNRRRNLPELKSRNYNIRSFGERLALNTPIQGTAADIIKKAMIHVYDEIKKRELKSKLILQVHDELIVDTYKPELDEVFDLVKTQMENAIVLSVPLIVDIGVGDSWYHAK